MKKCSKCEECKPIEGFSYKSKARDIRNSTCKACAREYTRQHYRDNKDYYLKKKIRTKKRYQKEYYEWLMDQSCVDCGIDDFRVLEHDHLRDKEFNISHMVGQRSLKGLMSEIEKCDVVCANCHRIRTINRGGFYKFLNDEDA